ncbi:hypothetical protein FRB97_008520 [Tulasnella sp. 331]|nr:hypothetical protein FRB97_008520 [Tulasnella sp. 331]
MEFDFEIEICDFTAGLEVVSFLDLLPTYRGIPRPGCPDDVTPSQDTSASSSAIEDPPSLLNATPGDAEQRGDSRFLSQLHSPFIPPKHLPPHPPDIPPPEGWVGSLRPWSSAVFDVIEAGNRHNMPGLMSSVALDYTRLVTFFDSKYKSLVKARRKQKRATYRVGNLTREEAGQARLEVEGMLVTWNPSNERTMGRVRWDAVVRTVIERYATRLEYLSVLLVEGASGRNKGNYSEDRKMNATKSAQRARWQVLTMLTPYMPAATQPRRDQPTDPDWLALTINHCAESSSAHIRSGTLTAPEKLIKGAVEAVTHEICRTMGVVWLDAFDVESKSEVEQEARMVKWLQELMRLKEWLGWTEWSDYVECEPRCSPHEMCTQPQWPLDIDWDGRGGEDLNQPYSTTTKIRPPQIVLGSQHIYSGFSTSFMATTGPQAHSDTLTTSFTVLSTEPPPLRPLSTKQERRLRDYLEDRFLTINRAFSKRSDPTSSLRHLSAYLTAMQPLMSMILLIPPLDPSASLRTLYLLRFTHDLLEAITSYPLVGPPPLADDDDPEVVPPIEVTLIQLFDVITQLDKGWRAVLLSQVWDPDAKAGTESHVSTGGVTMTDRIRLNSLLVTRKETMEEWLESGPIDLPPDAAEEFSNIFWRTFAILAEE